MKDKDELIEATSLKELFQGMVPEAMEVVKGKVVSASPLQIQLVNDEKMTVYDNIMCLPRHLTTYTAMVDISGGTVTAATGEGQGTHTHTSGGTHSHDNGQHEGHEDGDGGHTHSGDGQHTHSGDGSHTHSLVSFAINGATMTVNNALKVGEIVYILSFNHGKAYYILDREG